MINIWNILNNRLENREFRDVLSEAKFSLWELKNRKESDGSVFHKLEIFFPDEYHIDYFYDNDLGVEICEVLTEYPFLILDVDLIENLDEIELETCENIDYKNVRINLEKLLEE
jgi:hypothetical protein